MAEPLKNMYNPTFINSFCTVMKQAYPQFDEPLFTKLIFDEEWEARELKQRIRHITQTLHLTLPPSYPEAIELLMKIAPECKGFGYLFFPDYVEVYGLDHWDVSVSALKQFTSFSSSEFAVRPFIEKDPQRMMRILEQWGQDNNPHVRRLASEGCRPRLPWAAPIKMFKLDPSPILPILTLLKTDESEYVRKSVANNINDISKDHPSLVIKLCSDWRGEDPYTNWIIKHGARTLLRKADPEALRLFGFNTAPNIRVEELALSTNELNIGEAVTFHFVLVNPSPDTCQIRIEYGIDFVKANGSSSRKLFKITENQYKNGKVKFQRTHSFRNLSTRKHYAGQHRLSVVINGQEMADINFQVNT